MRWAYASGVLIFLVVGGFLFNPSPVDSVAWTPPAAPGFKGKAAPNELLTLSEIIAVRQVNGPEDVDVDSTGRVYAGNADGNIVRVWPDGRVEKWVNTGGRPLGLDFDARGNLIVADAVKGLLSVNADGEITTLTTEAAGTSFGFTDDADVGPDGMIYFSDASTRFGMDEFRLDLLEMRPHGRLLQYNPSTGKTRELLKDLHFANGVAVVGDGSYVLVNETWKYRTIKYWLKGRNAGKAETFVDNLPGFPDGIAADSEGRFWIALPTPRNPQIDAMHPHPWIKEQVAKLPDSWQPPVQRYGLVMAFDGDGKLLASLHDTKGKYLEEITSVQPHLGMLYFGTLHNDRIGRLPISAIPTLNKESSK